MKSPVPRLENKSEKLSEALNFVEQGVARLRTDLEGQLTRDEELALKGIDDMSRLWFRNSALDPELFLGTASKVLEKIYKAHKVEKPALSLVWSNPHKK